MSWDYHHLFCVACLSVSKYCNWEEPHAQLITLLWPIVCLHLPLFFVKYYIKIKTEIVGMLSRITKCYNNVISCYQYWIWLASWLHGALDWTSRSIVPIHSLYFSRQHQTSPSIASLGEQFLRTYRVRCWCLVLMVFYQLKLCYRLSWIMH